MRQNIIDKSSFNVKELVESVIDDFRPLIQYSKIQIRLLVIASEQDQLVCSDKLKIRQILIILVMNSLKLVTQGNVDIILKAGHEDSNYIKIIIQDRGTGMAEWQKEKIITQLNDINFHTLDGGDININLLIA